MTTGQAIEKVNILVGIGIPRPKAVVYVIGLMTPAEMDKLILDVRS